jgi:hypothetical protein
MSANERGTDLRQVCEKPTSGAKKMTVLSSPGGVL